MSKWPPDPEKQMTGSDSHSNKEEKAPLDGIVVADFSRVLAAPLATMMLGDLGAKVIKIERPDSGDDTRSWGPPYTEDGESAYFLSVNRNKRSVTLDLNDPRERSQALAIADSADVVIENFRAGTMQRFGMDYESLRQRNARVIYCRVSGFGNKSGRELPGYDFLVQSLSGLMSITGDSSGPPMKTGVAIVDVLTGLHATIGILAALQDRQRSGKGQSVEVNLFSSALASLVNQASSFITTGTVPTRIGNQHPSIAPYETFDTATTPIVIAVGNNGQFDKLCRALEDESMASNPAWNSNSARVTNRAALKIAIEDKLALKQSEHWLSVFRDAGIPSGPVNDIAGAFALARQLNPGAIVEIERTGGNSVASVANPIEFSRSPIRYDLAPPTLGSDSTEEILEWMRAGTMD